MATLTISSPVSSSTSVPTSPSSSSSSSTTMNPTIFSSPSSSLSQALANIITPAPYTFKVTIHETKDIQLIETPEDEKSKKKREREKEKEKNNNNNSNNNNDNKPSEDSTGKTSKERDVSPPKHTHSKKGTKSSSSSSSSSSNSNTDQPPPPGEIVQLFWQSSLYEPLYTPIIIQQQQPTTSRTNKKDSNDHKDSARGKDKSSSSLSSSDNTNSNNNNNTTTRYSIQRYIQTNMKEILTGPGERSYNNIEMIQNGDNLEHFLDSIVSSPFILSLYQYIPTIGKKKSNSSSNSNSSNSNSSPSLGGKDSHRSGSGNSSRKKKGSNSNNNNNNNNNDNIDEEIQQFGELDIDDIHKIGDVYIDLSQAILNKETYINGWFPFMPTNTTTTNNNSNINSQSPNNNNNGYIPSSSPLLLSGQASVHLSFTLSSNDLTTFLHNHIILTLNINRIERLPNWMWDAEKYHEKEKEKEKEKLLQEQLQQLSINDQNNNSNDPSSSPSDAPVLSPPSISSPTPSTPSKQLGSARGKHSHKDNNNNNNNSNNNTGEENELYHSELELSYILPNGSLSKFCSFSLHSYEFQRGYNDNERYKHDKDIKGQWKMPIRELAIDANIAANHSNNNNSMSSMNISNPISKTNEKLSSEGGGLSLPPSSRRPQSGRMTNRSDNNGDNNNNNNENNIIIQSITGRYRENIKRGAAVFNNNNNNNNSNNNINNAHRRIFLSSQRVHHLRHAAIHNEYFPIYISYIRQLNDEKLIHEHYFIIHAIAWLDLRPLLKPGITLLNEYIAINQITPPLYMKADNNNNINNNNNNNNSKNKKGIGNSNSNNSSGVMSSSNSNNNSNNTNTSSLSSSSSKANKNAIPLIDINNIDNLPETFDEAHSYLNIQCILSSSLLPSQKKLSLYDVLPGSKNQYNNNNNNNNNMKPPIATSLASSYAELQYGVDNNNNNNNNSNNNNVSSSVQPVLSYQYTGFTIDDEKEEKILIRKKSIFASSSSSSSSSQQQQSSSSSSSLGTLTLEQLKEEIKKFILIIIQEMKQQQQQQQQDDKDDKGEEKENNNNNNDNNNKHDHIGSFLLLPGSPLPTSSYDSSSSSSSSSSLWSYLQSYGINTLFLMKIKKHIENLIFLYFSSIYPTSLGQECHIHHNKNILYYQLSQYIINIIKHEYHIINPSPSYINDYHHDLLLSHPHYIHRQSFIYNQQKALNSEIQSLYHIHHSYSSYTLCHDYYIENASISYQYIYHHINEYNITKQEALLALLQYAAFKARIIHTQTPTLTINSNNNNNNINDNNDIHIVGSYTHHDDSEEVLRSILDHDTHHLSSLLLLSLLLLEHDHIEECGYYLNILYTLYSSHPLIIAILAFYHHLAEEDEESEECWTIAQNVLDTYNHNNNNNDIILNELFHQHNSGLLLGECSLSLLQSQCIDLYLIRILNAFNLPRITQELIQITIQNNNNKKNNNNNNSNNNNQQQQQDNNNDNNNDIDVISNVHEYSSFGVYLEQAVFLTKYALPAALSSSSSSYDKHILKLVKNKIHTLCQYVQTSLESIHLDQQDIYVLLYTYSMIGHIKYTLNEYEESFNYYIQYIHLMEEYKEKKNNNNNNYNNNGYNIDPLVYIRLAELYAHKQIRKQAIQLYITVLNDNNNNNNNNNNNLYHSNSYYWSSLSLLYSSDHSYEQSDECIMMAIRYDNNNAEVYGIYTINLLRKARYVHQQLEKKKKELNYSSNQIYYINNNTNNTTNNNNNNNNNSKKKKDDKDKLQFFTLDSAEYDEIIYSYNEYLRKHGNELYIYIECARLFSLFINTLEYAQYCYNRCLHIQPQNDNIRKKLKWLVYYREKLHQQQFGMSKGEMNNSNNNNNSNNDYNMDRIEREEIAAKNIQKIMRGAADRKKVKHIQRNMALTQVTNE